MAACSHGAKYDKCPPEKVAKEFNQADAGTGILKDTRRAQRRAAAAKHDRKEKGG